jgi:hypothetical protein
MVGAAGFEPATLWSQTRCATRLRYTPNSSVILASGYHAKGATTSFLRKRNANLFCNGVFYHIANLQTEF